VTTSPFCGSRISSPSSIPGTWMVVSSGLIGNSLNWWRGGIIVESNHYPMEGEAGKMEEKGGEEVLQF
jgi:hypothetical protein